MAGGLDKKKRRVSLAESTGKRKESPFFWHRRGRKEDGKRNRQGDRWKKTVSKKGKNAWEGKGVGRGWNCERG